MLLWCTETSPAACATARPVACRRQQEEEKLRKIAELEEAALAGEVKFTNRQEEAEQKTKKLKKLWKKFQEVGAMARWSVLAFVCIMCGWVGECMRERE